MCPKECPSLATRSIITRRYLGAWLVLAAALPLGIRGYYRSYRPSVFPFGWNPPRSLGVNYHTYHVAAEAALAGEDIYAAYPPGFSEGYSYLYPPVTVIGYVPFTHVEWMIGYVLHTIATVIGSVVATVLIVRYVEDAGNPLGWIDIISILALFLVSTHAMGTIFFGNINLLLGAAVVVGFVSLERGRESTAGLAFALAALFKVFPTLVGLWLVRDRQWRAIAIAIVTGLSGIFLGILMFGWSTSVRYFTEVLAARGGSLAFIGGYPPDASYYVTVQRPLSHLLWWVWPSAPYEALPVLAALVCASILLYFYRDLDTHIDRLLAMFATVVVTVLLFPAFRFYLVLVFFPLVALLYCWEDGHGRALFVFGGMLLSVTVRPAVVLDSIAGTPQPIHLIGSTLATYATIQLYALALMLVGCAWYKYTQYDYSTHWKAATDGWVNRCSILV